jgi:DNA topoisomerase I
MPEPCSVLIRSFPDNQRTGKREGSEMAQKSEQSVPISEVVRHKALEIAGRSKWWRRVGSKETGFHYVDKDGNRLKDKAVLERIKKLVIPPAWTDVRIAPSPSSRVQVVGIDTSGRPQYRYHSKFVAGQQRKKYDKLIQFGEQLPCLRHLTNQHLQGEGITRERTLAAMLRVVSELCFRVGSESSVERYRTFGITTLQNRHLTIGKNGKLQFDFIGKHHIHQKHLLVDAALAAVLSEIKALRGKRLFQYCDTQNGIRPLSAHDVNGYIKQCMGSGFSAKDFRTWNGTLTAALTLAELGAAETDRQVKRNINLAVKRVAEKLGNTPAVCRSSYIHPLVLENYERGVTLSDFRPKRSRKLAKIAAEMEPEEVALLEMLKQGAKKTLSPA